MEYDEFQKLLKTRGKELYRDMPWRKDIRPYYILVSEIMLQQTQATRVIPTFEAFIARFPTADVLANASFSDVLKLWIGLGYNRRARYLYLAAQKIQSEHGGVIPADIAALKLLPGVGTNTAGAIMVYAFNQPCIFIETNVRAVYFHCFFDAEEKVSDAQLVPLIEETLDKEHPREFYWALMDYGSWLKQTKGRAMNRQSLHYKKQSQFEGSIREVRGQIIRMLGEADQTLLDLRQSTQPDERFTPALEGLMRDGLVVKTDSVYHLAR